MNPFAKHLLIFGLLGPTLGFPLTVAVVIGFGMDPSKQSVLFIIFAYAFVRGILPAVLTGVVDWHLAARMKFSHRVFATAGLGYLLCTLVWHTLLNRRLSVGAVLIFALFGMVAAAICSVRSRRDGIF